MSDMTSNTPLVRNRREPGWEYWMYFAPIFALSLPLAVMRAGVAAVTSDTGPRPGIVTDAWARARDVTTTIFSV
ncbi:cytochrome PufQ [Jannaschia sp. M317]|uniref:cytochrome PufQ n=1 Tax=Jannaschia sp. M317 TaxID=2867011 RepID=UPI0021A8A3CA|nr:cytochrome PufQ [Jannaschia sp. M317]UWQ18343.1 protein pufQ [Jannaschia sp. M317]